MPHCSRPFRTAPAEVMHPGLAPGTGTGDWDESGSAGMRYAVPSAAFDEGARDDDVEVDDV